MDRSPHGARAGLHYCPLPQHRLRPRSRIAQPAGAVLGRGIRPGVRRPVVDCPRHSVVVDALGRLLLRSRLAHAHLVAVDTAGASTEVFACIRAESVTIERNLSGNPTSARNRLAARIVSVIPEGPLARVTLDCGFRLTAIVTRQSEEEMRLREGEQVTAVVKATSIGIVPRG